VTGDLWTAPARTDETLSSLTEAERYRRFDALQARLPHVWEHMRLNHEDESVVVVPSITLDKAVADSGSLTQAYEERFLFLLMLLRQPRGRGSRWSPCTTPPSARSARSSSSGPCCCPGSRR